MLTFDDAVRAHSGKLRRKAEALVWRVGVIEADDLLQETWLMGWRQWAWVTAVGDAGIRMRLFHILKQRFIQMLRARNAIFRRTPEIGSDGAAPDSPHRVAEARQTFAAVEALPRNWRDALVAIAKGFTTEERAADEGVKRQAVEQRIKRARGELVAAGYGA